MNWLKMGALELKLNSSPAASPQMCAQSWEFFPLSASFLMCKMGMIMLFTALGSWQDLSSRKEEQKMVSMGCMCVCLAKGARRQPREGGRNSLQSLFLLPLLPQSKSQSF